MKTATRRPVLVISLAALSLVAACSGPPATVQTKKETTTASPSVVAPTQDAIVGTAKGKTELAVNIATPLSPMLSPAPRDKKAMSAGVDGLSRPQPLYERMMPPPMADQLQPLPPGEQESYNPLAENPLVVTANDPLSTFSIDVDTASYANVRRLIGGGTLPPPGAVRIEEMINYFTYDYAEPSDGPIGVTSELGPCPWRPQNKLVRLGIKGRDLPAEQIPPSNLVFLIDVSGSMNQPNKLPLLQQSLTMLAEQLSGRDRIAMVVYAGSNRVVLPPTAGDKTVEIKAAIAALAAGGSTYASGGIATAYQLARQSFMPGANNRIILASDGDFNVGVTSRDELERLIARERESGIYLTVLGFGMGNYRDDTMEILADKGNGNYAYIDSLLEARKVLVKERVSNLFALANDVKIQVEFNPAMVSGYRLLGYENRMMADEDFKNDKKDAGEIGVGHRVTALYELYPVGSPDLPKVDGLKYQTVAAIPGNVAELLTVKVRFKPLQESAAREISRAVATGTPVLSATSDDFRFAAAVAGFGMLLRQTEPVPGLTYPLLRELAKNSRGKDDEGYRAEFLRLLENAEMLVNYSKKAKNQ